MRILLTLAGSLAIAASAPAFAEDAAQSTPASAEGAVEVKKGQVVFGGNGKRIGKVFRVSPEGPQIIINQRLVTVPASSLSVTDGKISTTFNSRDLVK